MRTTSLLVDHDILIDAGTGLSDLPLDELAAIDHVFITHSHLDHIAALPLMVDSVADLREHPLTIHATAATLETIRSHVFNWAIWPDFSEIAIRDRQVMRYNPIAVGQKIPPRHAQCHRCSGRTHRPGGRIPSRFGRWKPGFHGGYDGQ